MRFEEVTKEELALMEDLRKEYFEDTKQAKVKLLFDVQKRSSKGKLVLGRCKRTDDLIRHLTQEEAETMRGYDFIISLDKKAWTEAASDEDKVRVLRHELRHIEYDPDNKDFFVLRPHDIEDFSAEIELNMDDVKWAETLAGKTMALYEAEKEGEEGFGSFKSGF